MRPQSCLNRCDLPLAVALSFAFAKAILVAGWFMGLAHQSRTHRLVAMSAIVMIALLIGLAALDLLTRTDLSTAVG